MENSLPSSVHPESPSLPSFVDPLSPVYDEADAIDIAFSIAGAFEIALDENELERWLSDVVPRVWDLLEPELLEGQLNLFEDWDDVVAGLPERLLSKLPDDVCRSIPSGWPSDWKATALIGYLDSLLGESSAAPAAATKVVRDRVQQKLPVDPDPAAIVVSAGSSAGRLTGLALLEAVPQWAALLPASRQVFTFMYRRADRRKTPAQPWCQVSVGLLMKVTGYRERQCRNALAQLRRGRWIGYIVRGRPRIGGSRYWVATSPFQLGDGAVRSLVSKFGFKP